MPAPPPPPPPSFNLGSNSGDQRGALLQSIRAGKALKKTVTVDKSAPALGGKVVNDSSNVNSSSSAAISNSRNAINNGNPPIGGLGGLFSGGMPKLKPTGLRGKVNPADNGNVVTNVNSTPTPPISAKRGPPPVPPPATQKPQVFSSIIQPSDTGGAEGLRGYNKPTLAPKPPLTSNAPQKPSPPPKKLMLASGGMVSRAQSMRLPRSPPVLAPTPPSLHQSQDCLNEPQHRPTNRILRPPVSRPPSPPISRSNGTSTSSTAITRVAPPPPCRAPTIPPPPPPLPHRAASTSRLAPPVPPLTPPTPPTRGLSLRNGQSPGFSDFYTRFSDMFHSIANFPPPDPFQGFQKVYNSKAVAAMKQQAPAPPLRSTSTSGNSALNSTSTVKPQWQQNAASSAC